MQSIEKRVNGNDKEIIKNIERGWWNYVCDEVLHCAPDSLQRWYQKQPSCEGKSIFSLKRGSWDSQNMSLGEQIVAAIKADRERDAIEKFKLQTKITEQDERIKFLERQMRIAKAQDYAWANSILDTCEAQPVMEELRS